MDLITVGQAAEHLSRLDPNGDVPAAYYARQLRAYLATGVLHPAAREGMGRKSALLDAPRLCVALLASRLQRFGLQSGQLSEALDRIRHVDAEWYLRRKGG